MEGLQLLKDDHDRFKKLLAEGEETTERAAKTRTELFTRLKTEIEIHERMEEEVLGDTPTDHREWLAKFTVARENLEHHIDEEERDMFPMALRMLKSDELDEIGRRMAEIRELGQQVAGD